MAAQEELDFSPRAPLTRQEQIDRAFDAFHEANPGVWELFERFSLEAARAQRENFSASAVVERIRWYTDIETVGGEGLKINNNFRANYARMFHAAHPEHGRFFRNRIRRSATRKPAARDRQVFIDDEEEL